jgi:sensor histidine kinase YesM
VLDQIKNILITGLTEKLKVHHSVYRLPCTSEFLEELIASVLTEAGYTNDWQPNRSHSISVDMSLDSGQSFSVKSGVYANNTLTFSGSRLGKHVGLDNMIASVIDNSADYYVCLAKSDQDWSSVPSQNEKKVYYLFVFPSQTLMYDSGVWNKVDTKSGGYNYVMESIGMSARINTSMSSQLWTSVNESLTGSPTKLEIL